MLIICSDLFIFLDIWWYLLICVVVCWDSPMFRIMSCCLLIFIEICYICLYSFRFVGMCWLLYLRRVEQSGQMNSRLNVLLSLGLWLSFPWKYVFLSLAPAWRDAFTSINSWKIHSNSIVLSWKDIDLKPYGHEWAR